MEKMIMHAAIIAAVAAALHSRKDTDESPPALPAPINQSTAP